MQRTKTFLDGLVHLCVGPKDNWSVTDPIEYVRPRINGTVRAVDVGTVRGNSLSNSRDASVHSRRANVTVRHRNAVPAWVMDVLEERLNSEGTILPCSISFLSAFD